MVEGPRSHRPLGVVVLRVGTSSLLRVLTCLPPQLIRGVYERSKVGSVGEMLMILSSSTVSCLPIHREFDFEFVREGLPFLIARSI